ncbi:MAG: M23 family metallopeptidase [Lachnospiraceae bacterium]|nr:M23 family metallopeptidase [Lachnospiraceae bacterium]
MNRRNNRRPAMQKEKLSIIAASVFVLSALTLAGVYMSARSNTKTEENKIDFARLEQEQLNDGTTQENGSDTRFVSGNAKADLTKGNTGLTDTRYENTPEIDMYDLSDNNDMDVDPNFTEVNSGNVSNIMPENTTLEGLEGTDKAAVFMNDEEVAEPLSFAGTDTLTLPVVGEVLLDYSMDKAIYHATMQQYKYNPALVLAAPEGTVITAAAEGVVKSIYYDSQTGNTVTFDVGDGYELTYGQLEELAVAEGDRVSVGDLIGKVAAPTIYYSEEGSNVYFKLTKDGTPVDPLTRGQED